MLVLFLNLLAALTEVVLAKFVADLIDLLKGLASPATLFADHAGLLLWMAFVVLFARPVIFVAYELTKSQVLSPPFQAQVRWQAHRYVLRQSMEFFHNDFAGRVATKADADRAGGARRRVEAHRCCFTSPCSGWRPGDVRPPTATSPCLCDTLARRLCGLPLRDAGTSHPQVRQLSEAQAEARSILTGRVVDSYTNILTVKLFAHAEREDALCARRASRSRRRSTVRLRAASPRS